MLPQNTEMEILQDYLFRDRIISRSVWPTRSPDLSPPDFL
jgi:hypothetical protein